MCVHVMKSHTHVSVRTAILTMDEYFLTEDNMLQLLKCMPTDDEMRIITSYTGDVALLGTVEQFFASLSDVMDITQRVKWMLFQRQVSGVACASRSWCVQMHVYHDAHAVCTVPTMRSVSRCI